MSKRELGTAMVELAIIMPFLVILVFGITELGRALYQEQVLVKSSASAARYLARGYEVLASDCTTQGDWGVKEANAKTLAVNAGGSGPVIPNLTISDVSVSVDQVAVSGVGNECVITVSIQKLFDGVFGDRLIPMTNIGQITLNAQSQEVYIGE